MIYLFGNCQTEFLCNALNTRGRKAVSRQLASPLTYADSPGRVDEELVRQVEEHQAADYFHLRSLDNQLVLLSPADEAADCAVFSMFHEPGPLFVHNEAGYSFFMDPAVLDARPVLGEYLREHFQLVRLHPGSYFQRFGRMIERFQREHPDVPVLILSRLSHFPGFGPAPYSYLEGWDRAWQEAVPALEAWAAGRDNCRVVSMDKVFAHIWRSSGSTSMEAHCPFLKFGAEGESAPPYPQHVRRDLEHVGSMWPVLAEVILELLRTGATGYGGSSAYPEEWFAPHVPERLGLDRMARDLSSGANYLFARALSSMFTYPDRDLSSLLAQAAETAPICHNCLHMARAYIRLHPSRHAMAYLMRHRTAAERFTSNGEAYRIRYLDRLDTMLRETRALQRAA